MSLTKKQFQVLEYMEEKLVIAKQRELEQQLHMSLGTVNKIYTQLTEMGYISNKQITKKGIEALEPYRVKRAIIIAAGFGSRLVPVTLNTPKPLVRVNGVRIIDSILDALLEVGITDITIVRGYLSDSFGQLLEKYPNLKFVDNSEYKETNNISSVYQVKENLGNAYILEGDMIIKNKRILLKYQYETNYVGVKVTRTDDWVMVLNAQGFVKQMKMGGEHQHLMYGVSYWTKEDGAQLAQDIEKVYQMPGGKEQYWDKVAIDYFPKNYKINVRNFKEGDIIEIDNYSELQALDASYK